MTDRASSKTAPPVSTRRSAPPEAPTRVLRRKCACGARATSGADCDACKQKQSTLHRKAYAPRTNTVAPPVVHEVLRQSGKPLDRDVRADLETRFSRDLSGVRVHTDGLAARSARAVGALAYNVGPHVVFGDRQYEPRAEHGRQLLAHELAHVLRHGSATTAADAPIAIGEAYDAAEHDADRVAAAALRGGTSVSPASARPRLRRKVADSFAKLKDDLTYGLFDWAITDAEAREALGILKPLSDEDLTDTVAAMDAEGITGRLFNQLPDQDVKANQELLKKVARLRTWKEKAPDKKKTSRRGSCDPEQAKFIEAAHVRGGEWLQKSLQKLTPFRASPKDPAQKDVADIFNAYFFSTDQRVIDYVHIVLQEMQSDFANWNLFRLDCFGEWASTCHAAGAYAEQGPPPTVTFCDNFLDNDEDGAADTVIHEIAHIQPNVEHITDRAYSSNRLIRALHPEEALTNADSYALLVRHLVLGKSGVYAPKDDYQDCPDDWKPLLKEATARAERANRNAQVVFPSITAASLKSRLTNDEQKWLHGSDDKAIKNALEAFDKAEKRFEESIDFECEPKGGGRCDGSPFYWYALGDLHVCPSWPKLAAPERELRLLAGFYGYIGAGDGADQQLDLARLAYSVSNRIWAPPTLHQVLGGPSAWTPDELRIHVEPVKPAIPSRVWYTEDGRVHGRMSQDLKLYVGPECGRGPLQFKQRLRFSIDGATTPRPRPFLAPLLKAQFALTAATRTLNWNFEDRRPLYRAPGSPLDTQLPDPITLWLPDDGTLHSRISLDDPSSGANRSYEDDLQIKAKDPCPRVATAKDPRPPVRKEQQAFATQLTGFVTDVKGKIETLVQGTPPKGEAWANSANPNVLAVLTLLDDLEVDLKGGHLLLRFDQPTGTSASAHYDVLADEMHLQPPASVDLAKEVVDLVHEYTHVKQDRAEEAKLIAQKVPTAFDKSGDLGQEIEARKEETYFTRLMQLAGVKFGPKADLLSIELTARVFVRQFETERTGKPKARKAATQEIRKSIESAYQQQFKDNGTFGDYPLEITADNRAMLYASSTGKEPPVDFGELPATVETAAQLEAHLYNVLSKYPDLPKLFVGPKKQAYNSAVFTVFFRQRRLIQFGIPKP